MSLNIASCIGIFCLGYAIARLDDIKKKLTKSINSNNKDLSPSLESVGLRKEATGETASATLGIVVSKEEYETFLELLSKPSTLPPHLLAKLNGKSEIPTPKPIEINERLFITDIKHDTLEKKYETDLGETTNQADPNFSASVSKLTSLKQKKDS